MDGVSILGRPADDLLGNDEEKLLEIPVPCVVVLGTGRRTGKFDLQLNLRNVFQQAGYSVTQFGSKEYSSLFGFDPLPQFLFDLGSQREKILAFNHLVYETVKRDNSDVVLLGVPGGIMPINPFEFDEYGELAFLMGDRCPCRHGNLQPLLRTLSGICFGKHSPDLLVSPRSANKVHEPFQPRFVVISNDPGVQIPHRSHRKD